MAIEEHVSTNGEFLEYARRELWNSATLVRRAFHCLSLIVLGVIVATGIFLGAVAAVAIFASNKIDVCNNWEIASHRGGVSVWRQVSLFVVNHRVTFSINSERAEDRYGRPIITSVLHRRPNEHWTGPAILLNSFQKPAPFIMELPFYRRPKWGLVLRLTMMKTKSYIVNAGPTIFGFVLILWLGTHFPGLHNANPSDRLRESVVGQAGQLLEPVFKPMGSDWRVGVSLMSAFVAREVFVSSLAVILNVTAEKEGIQDSLLANMREARTPDGHALFTPASVAALIVFFMIALQCLSTTSVVWRETGSAKFAFSQILILNSIAYVLAIIVYQSLAAAGLG